MPFGNEAWFRYPFGWMLPPKMTLLKASHNTETREASIRKQIYQDVAFPAAKLREAVDLSERLFGIFPLLCYPCAPAAVDRREHLVELSRVLLRQSLLLGAGICLNLLSNLARAYFRGFLSAPFRPCWGDGR